MTAATANPSGVAARDLLEDDDFSKESEDNDTYPKSEEKEEEEDKSKGPDAAAAAAALVNRQRHNKIPRTFVTSLNSSATSTGSNSSLEEQERLSSDLALFLSNPSLRAALSDGSLDLASYSSTIDKELDVLESECIGLYRSKARQIAELREEMDVCDTVLASLQEMLLGFQADLGGLSGDIRQLQEQSRTLGIQLLNRRRAESGLRQFLERIVVPPNLAEVICRGPVDELFMDCVKDLNEKYAYVHSNYPHDDVELTLSGGIPPNKTKAGKEMKVHIHKLRLSAVGRVREYFLRKIAELRRPKTNVRMMQINSLLKYADLNDFLAQAAPDIYGEIRDVYVESMGKTLHALFRTYAAQLSRLDAKIATRNDLIAIDDAALRDVFSTKVNMTKRGDTFFLGDRANVLDVNTASSQAVRGPILAHVALAEGERYPYEMIFRSVMVHLMDAATNEFVFTRQFFKENGREAFTLLFGRTLSLVLEQLENYLFNCYDCLGLLLMIKLTHGNRRIMKGRKVSVLDPFFDRVTNLLWPRLKVVMDAQLRSIRGATAKKLGGVDLHAHYVSRRYAEFTCSILLILNKGKKPVGGLAAPVTAASSADGSATTSAVPSTPSAGAVVTAPGAAAPSASSPSHRGSAGDMLMNDLTVILDETVLLLERMSDEHSTNKKKIVFLINNYDQILCIFQERRVAGKEMQKFVELLMRQRELFVEEELLQSFSKMIAFVQQTEAHMSGLGLSRGGSSAGGGIDINTSVVQSLVSEFAATWKKGIEQINRNVLSYFSNFRNGMEILKQVLTQLLLYYTRFQDIIRKVWRSKPPAFCKDLVSTTVILAEIKKYALAI